MLYSSIKSIDSSQISKDKYSLENIYGMQNFNEKRLIVKIFNNSLNFSLLFIILLFLVIIMR